MSTSAAAPVETPRKRRRIFMWVFLAIQALFLFWVISGASTGSGTPDSCQGLHKAALQTCNDASDVGTGIGVILILLFWCVIDFLLAVGYVIYRVARRP